MSSRFFENPITRSLAAHLVLLLLVVFFMTQAKTPVFDSDPIEITVMDPKPQAKHAESSRNKSIVLPSQGEEAKEAKKDAYLSDKTRVVQEEKSTSNAGEITERARTTTKGEASQAQSKPVQAAPKVSLSDLGMKLSPKVNKNYEQQRNWANAQTGEALKGGQYIQGMKEGEVSALNTKEFVFFSYFNRVRKQLDQAWTPMLTANIQKIFRSGRKLASNEDYVTRTLVVLNGRGEIVKIQMLEESGTHDIDQAAIDALNKSGPYPNPPKGLIDSDGLVQIRWDFILKT